MKYFLMIFVYEMQKKSYISVELTSTYVTNS